MINYVKSKPKVISFVSGYNFILKQKKFYKLFKNVASSHNFKTVDSANFINVLIGLSFIYLTLPVIIFINGYLKLELAIPLNALICFSLYKSFAETVQFNQVLKSVRHA